MASVENDLRAFVQKPDDADLFNASDGSVTKEFRTFSQKWGDSQIFGSSAGTVSYSFANQNRLGQFGTFDSFITDPGFQAEIRTSLSSWENIADIRFIEELDSSTIDIRFGWREIDGNGGVLGQTTVPSAGRLKDVVIALDSSEDWFLGGNAPIEQIDFSSVVTHEIGHGIGIDHSESEQALMAAEYSPSIFTIQPDDINAVVEIYGATDVERIDVHRFYNPTLGGHFFTADILEKESVDENSSFNPEGVGFEALSRQDTGVSGSVPVYRFFNPKLGSHFFTAFEAEKDHVLELDDFVFEGVGYRAFDTDSTSTVPVHRFFNTNSGGHFFTASEIEKVAVSDNANLRYEGEAFYAFLDIGM